MAGQYCSAVDKLKSPGISGYLGTVTGNVFDFGEAKSFQNQDNDDTWSDSNGNESGERPSPEMASNGK